MKKRNKWLLFVLLLNFVMNGIVLVTVGVAIKEVYFNGSDVFVYVWQFVVTLFTMVYISAADYASIKE